MPDNEKLKRIQDLLEMHCMFRMDAWDCEKCSSMKCAECLAKHLVAHGVTVKDERGTR